MDKTWIKQLREAGAYEIENTVSGFLYDVFVGPYHGRYGKMCCPCFKCGGVKRLRRREVFDHIICDGFLKQVEDEVQGLRTEVQVLKEALTTVISIFQKQSSGEDEEILNTIASMVNREVSDASGTQQTPCGNNHPPEASQTPSGNNHSPESSHHANHFRYLPLIVYSASVLICIYKLRS